MTPKEDKTRIKEAKEERQRLLKQKAELEAEKQKLQKAKDKATEKS